MEPKRHTETNTFVPYMLGLGVGAILTGLLGMCHEPKLITVTCGDRGVGSSSWQATFYGSELTVNGISYIKGGDGQLYLKPNKEKKLEMLSSEEGGVVVKNDSAVFTATLESDGNVPVLSVDAHCGQ